MANVTDIGATAHTPAAIQPAFGYPQKADQEPARYGIEDSVQCQGQHGEGRRCTPEGERDHGQQQGVQGSGRPQNVFAGIVDKPGAGHQVLCVPEGNEGVVDGARARY